MTIAIRHTHEDGTLIEGTAKGDGVYQIVKPLGFRYFPSIQMIGIQSSRDQVAKRGRINGAAEALRAAGFEVEVEIDDTPRDRGEVLADQADRLDERHDRLDASAQRHAAAADAAHSRADQLGERFYMGQPILIGHHSERGARADQRRIEQAMDKSCAEQRTAAHQAGRAAAVGTQLDRSARPDVTARRIKTAESELRVIARNLDGYERNSRNGRGVIVYTETHGAATGTYREELLARQALLTAQLEYDRQSVAEAVAAGRYTAHNAETVHVGDLVHNGWSWKTVVKVNRTTVGCESGYSWTDKVKFTDIRRVRCTHTADAEEADS